LLPPPRRVPLRETKIHALSVENGTLKLDKMQEDSHERIVARVFVRANKSLAALC
jgi:hypothetical protein